MQMYDYFLCLDKKLRFFLKKSPGIIARALIYSNILVFSGT